jgi:hypothetical protein
MQGDCREPALMAISPQHEWITRERVKVDRVACPWLIQNFIDPEAAFFFVRLTTAHRWTGDAAINAPRGRIRENG